MAFGDGVGDIIVGVLKGEIQKEEAHGIIEAILNGAISNEKHMLSAEQDAAAALRQDIGGEVALEDYLNQYLRSYKLRKKVNSADENVFDDAFWKLWYDSLKNWHERNEGKIDKFYERTRKEKSRERGERGGEQGLWSRLFGSRR